MDHANHRQVFDGGPPDSGRPYFVMELVKGVPITDFCEPEPPDPAPAAGTVRQHLSGGANTRSKGHHPPRPEALQPPRHGARHDAGGEGNRLRCGQGAGGGTHREDAVHRVRPDDRHAPVMSPEQAGQSGSTSIPQRLYSLGVLLYDSDRHDAVHRCGSRRPRMTRSDASSARRQPPRPSMRLSELGKSGDPTRTAPLAPLESPRFPRSPATEAGEADQAGPRRAGTGS